MDDGQGNPKVILITGTSSGIGLELAVELAKRGARVFASMRDVDKAEALQSAATSAGVAVEVVALDVTSEESVVEALARVESAAGRIDVVVNNAAVTTYGPIEFTPQASVETMFATNIIGAIRVVRAVLPGMRRQGSGRIVNVGSLSAEPRVGIRLLGVYAATKAALHAFSLELNKELAPIGIDVVLCEGGVGGRTQMFTSLVDGVARFGQGDGAYTRVESTARAFADMVATVALDPVGAATMIADACLVASPGVRHPLSAQAAIDTAHAVSDDDYLRLCGYDDEAPAIVTRNGLGPVWLLV